MATLPLNEDGPSTQARLATIVQGFDDFESEMRRGTRQRREKDEQRISELKSEMKRLDADLSVEIKRRTEMNKSTQMWFEENLERLDKSFNEALNARNVASNKRIDEVNTRITALDERLQIEKADILRQIEEQGIALNKLLIEFKDEFDQDRKLRLAREESIQHQLGEHEQLVAEKFQNLIEVREERYASIKTVLEENIKLREKAEERFQALFEREIHLLHNQLNKESEIREREDDEIVESLNRYTIKLQNSLKVVNATDM